MAPFPEFFKKLNCMRVLIQRVSEASVTINQKITASIHQGLLLFIGLENTDNREDIEWLCHKISNLRIFNDENKVMNRNICDMQGDFLVISQFTLHAATKKGNRPSYIRASKPEIALPLYEEFIATLKNISGLIVKTGEFGADMQVALINDGPVTIFIDTKNKE
jgi:D-aminoacyl-tRNA deacylase